MKDSGLVSRLLSRDPRAWEDLIRLHGGKIEASCRRALLLAGLPADPGSAADACAETLKALLTNDMRLLKAYRPEAPLEAYLCVIARSRTLNAVRSLAPAGGPPAEEPSVPASEALLLAERSRLLHEALDNLPPRDALLLRLLLQGLDYRGIAREAGVPEAQVGTLLLRARGRLKEALGADFPESA